MATGAGHTCSSHPVWSYYTTGKQHEPRPTAVTLQSICTHAPLRSIALAPHVDQTPQPPTRKRVLPPALLPHTAHDELAEQQLVQRCWDTQRQQQQQQQLLEHIMHVPCAPPQQQQQQQEQEPEQSQPQPKNVANLKQQADAPPPPLLKTLLAGAKLQAVRERIHLQPLLCDLVSVLPVLSSHQLAQAAKAASSWPDGPAAAAAAPGWLQGLLAAATDLFAAGQMDQWATSVLLDALVKLGVRPSTAWLGTACAGMQVQEWRSSRALATVAATLPQLGCVPSSSWAAAFFNVTTDSSRLERFPPISLARMLHGVVAWRHLQRQERRQEEGGEQLALQELWLCCVLQRLHACSSELKPCEVAMVVQALQRLQQPGFLPEDSSSQNTTTRSSSSSSSTASHPAAQQPISLLQLSIRQLLHALLPAVARQRQQFAARDMAVVLHSLALLQEQQQQEAGYGWVQQQGQQLSQQEDAVSSQCSFVWLQQVLGTVQERLFDTNARTQTTLLWATAVLMQPHLQQQAQQQKQRQQEQQQHVLFQQQEQQQEQPVMEPPNQAQAQQQEVTAHVQQQPRHKQGQALLQRPVWLGSHQNQDKQQQQQSVSHAGTGAAGPDATLALLTGSNSVAVVSPSSAAAAAAADTDAAALWAAWLDRFHAASLPRLAHFSAEDVVVAALTLATQQQVPPAVWYEQLLAAVQQRLQVLTPSQVSGVAWALGRMALLPCRHNPGASLVPLQPWLHQLYARTGLQLAPAAEQQVDVGSAAGAAGSRAGTSSSQPPGKAGAASLQGSSQHVAGACISAGELVRLMWTAGVCEYDPGDTWWTAAEQQLLTPSAATLEGSSNSGNGLASTATHPNLSDTGSIGQQEQEQPLLPAVSQLPPRLLGALLQAYVSAGRQLPPQLLRAVLTPRTAQQLCTEPLVNTLRVLQGLLRAGSTIPQPWLQQLAIGMQQRLVALSPWELGQLLLCFADAGLQLQGLETQAASDSSSDSSSSTTSSTAVAGSWTAAVAAACQQRLPGMTARDVTMVLSAAAKLQLQLPQALLQGLLQQMQRSFLDAPPAALSVGIDAVTRLGMVPSGDWLGSFLMATHRTFTTASAALCRTGSARSRLALVHAILQTLQGLARLKATLPRKWLKQQLLLLHGQLPVLQPRDVASLLLLLARLRCRPSPMYLQSMLEHLGDCKACNALDLVHIAYSIASLRWQPRRHWMGVFLEASAGKMQEMSGQGLALLMWALAVTRVTPPARTWRRAAVQAVAARVGQFDALQLGMILWAWGRLCVHITPLPHMESRLVLRKTQQQQQQQQQVGVVDVAVAQQHQQHQQHQAAGRIASGSHASSRRRHFLSAAKLHHQTQHGRFLQQRGPQLAEQLLDAAVRMRGDFNASQLTHLLVGVAKMRLGPNQAWLHTMVTRGSSQEPLSVLSGYQMQQLLWALARMQYRAPVGWVRAMGVLLETRSQQNDSTRHSAAWALQQLQKLAV